MIIVQLDSEQLSNVIQNAVRKVINETTQSSEPETEQLLTIQQAGKLLNLSVPTLYSLVSRKEIPVCKRSKRLYFSNKELLQWVKSGRKQTLSEINNEADIFLAKQKK